MKLKPFKIQVNPEQSEYVQKCVFAHGGEWFKKDMGTTVHDTDKPYLTYGSIMNPDKYYLLFSSIEHKQTFDENKAPEITFGKFKELYGI